MELHTVNQRTMRGLQDMHAEEVSDRATDKTMSRI